MIHWQTVVDDDAVYLIGEVDGGPVALKITHAEHMPHAELAASIAQTLNWAAPNAMTNTHPLRPCVMCPTRMAVPNSPLCTKCAAELLAGES